MSSLADNLAAVRDKIAEAATRKGRRAEDVTLVAVTKYVDAATTRMLAEAGCLDLGESRTQSLWQKAAELADLPVRWHLIGHLQRNKVRRTLSHLTLLHSLDSVRLLDCLEADSIAIDRDQPLNALLEINVSGDADKTGAKPEEAATILQRVADCPHVRVCGLMGMATGEGKLEAARRDFVRLRELRDELQSRFTGRFDLSQLSMGMSHDFEIAIEEGATLVRVGSALFA